MKKFRCHGVITACLWFALGPLSHAQTGAPESKPPGGLTKQVRVQVEFIDVSHEQLTELMFGPKVAANDTELRKQVAQLVKDGKATILETMLCTTSSGQKATTESNEELIYPTEYEPAELPNEIHTGDKNDAAQPADQRGVFATGPTPTAFEMRPLGSTLEIAPTLSEDGKVIDLRFVPEIVYHVGNQIWTEWKGAHGNSPIQMPTYYKLSINTAITLAAGHPMLVAALSPKNKDGHPDFSRKLMVFVKADVLTLGR